MTTGLLATTWSPSSCQLQFSFRLRKSPTALFIRNRIRSVDCHRRIRVRCLAVDESSGSKRHRSGDSWTSSDPAGNAFTDWDGSEQLDDGSRMKGGIEGIVGPALAGALLVAGLTFAAFAIGKKSTSRPALEMKPLAKEQETLSVLDEEVDDNAKEGPDVNGYDNFHQNERNLANEPGEEEKSLPSPEVDDSSSFDTDIQASSELNVDASSGKNLLIQEDLHDEPGFEVPDGLRTDTTTDQLPALESSDGPSVGSSFVDSESTLDMGTSGEVSEIVSSDTILLSNSDEQPEPDAIVGLNDSSVVHESLSTVVSVETLSLTDLPGDSTDALPLQEGQSFADKAESEDRNDMSNGSSVSESLRNTFASIGNPAPSTLPPSLMSPPGKVLIPAMVDQAQGQALAALQVLKVIEVDALPSELCTRREYARWLVSASSALSRNPVSKVHPAMYIENVTQLAFEDITPEDPDFPSIQGLAEAGLISSKLSKLDMLSSPDEDVGSFSFFPDSPLCRQDLVSWKMALEKREFPEADRKILQQTSGFIDIDRIDPDAWPLLIADLSSGEHGIIALAFGYTRLFQPDKPVTKGQAAIALSTGESSEIVGEELTRIEAESIADNAVAAHNALVAQVEEDINSSFEKELLLEREKINAVEKMAEEAKLELARLREEREKDNVALMRERTAVESEMEILSRLRHEVEEQLETVMGKKAEISLEKEQIDNLKKSTEEENHAVARLQYELEVERKALSMARSWAEDEAKRVREHAKALEEARDRWEKRGLKIMVDQDLQDEASPDNTWVNVEKQLSVDATVDRAENLVGKLKRMAGEVSGKSQEVINLIVLKIVSIISALKEWASKTGERAIELKNATISKAGESMQQLQHSTTGISVAIQDGTKRVAVDCKESVEKLTQKFKAS